MYLNKILVGTRCEEIEKSYLLIERQTDNGHVYGVMVTNKNYECCMPGIFENRREAEKFIDLIMKNNVSPTHLSEIADDYMSSREIGA